MLLTIESTCDETAAAVIDPDGRPIGNCVATQDELHRRFRGVVPEIAARAHVQNILPVIETAMTQANIEPSNLTAIAVADRPGLAGSLLVGVVAAKTLAMVWDKPLVAVNHLHAHLYACQLAAQSETPPREVYPCVGLVVSGGHTSLYRCDSPLDLTYLGGTIDDAAGEAFDKVAAMLNLGFPGGPAVSKLAAKGDPAAYAFPRSMLNKDNHDFSFSGLKTAVRYAIVGRGSSTDPSTIDVDPQTAANLCASFESAVVETIVTKCIRAAQQTGVGDLIVGGGVAANGALRRGLQTAADEAGLTLTVAPMSLCTDNAVMGAIAWEKIRREEFADLSLSITPGLQRGF